MGQVHRFLPTQNSEMMMKRKRATITTAFQMMEVRTNDVLATTRA
jgi:hypothetical protein